MKPKHIVSSLVAIIAVCITAAMMTGCSGKTPKPKKFVRPDVTSDTLYVKKVENLPDDFIMGMDASSVISLENSGVKYYDFDGNEADVFKTLSENGINTIRVRVWNKPFDAQGNGFGGGNCDINTAIEIGKRATKYGMNLMVDFHYSDFWADPSKQMVPIAWSDMDIDEKSEALYNFTKECLEKLYKEKIAVNVVQVGNETNGKLCGESIWMNIYKLMAAGSKAVREVYPDALVAVHFANPEKSSNYLSWASKLDYYGLDYDVFASSYYPYWHGTLDNLQATLSDIATKYNKKVMVAETSYAYTEEDTDFSGNTIGPGSGVTKSYPYTVQGQANSVRNIIETIANTTNGIGVCYWEGTWITVGQNSYEENFVLWEKYGSGWASSFSKFYDPADAGKYFGGSAVDNQAMFDADGKPLESLKIFALVSKGNEIETKADALEDVNMIVDLNGKIELPTTVNAVMTDDSKKPISVEWNITDTDIEKMYSGGAQKYDITGKAGGMTAHCYISMVEKNFIKNYSFEEDSNKAVVPVGWQVVNNKPSGGAELYVETDKNNSVTGDNHFRFWSKAADTVDFTLEQTVQDVAAGKYKYSISISGGDGGNTVIYAYVKINGTIIKKSDALYLKGYQNWQTALIEDIDYNGTDEITVGIYVQCSGEGGGAWGKIDDALLNSVAIN